MTSATACGHCGGSWIDTRGDFPTCMTCGWEDYSSLPLSAFRIQLAAKVGQQPKQVLSKGERFCADCGEDISHSYRAAEVCLTCRYKRDSTPKVRTA